LKALRPNSDGRRVVHDRALPGLCVRVSARGPVFYVVKRDPVAKKPRWVRLGDYPTLSLKQARQSARDALAAISEGQPAPVPARNAMSFADVVELYKLECLSAKRTRNEIEAALNRVVDEIGDRPANSIRHEDLAAFLERVAQQTARNATGSKIKSGGPHAAAKLKAYLNPLFKWAAYHRKGGIIANPMAAIPASELLRGKTFNRARDHVISDADLRTIWKAASEYPYPYGPLVRALVCTGQRLSEIAEARWSEIDQSTGCLIIPPERMKNRRVHALPLTERMRALFAGLPRFDRGDFIFTTTFGARPVSGHSKFKPRFDQAVADIGPVIPWRLHDLRRAARTGLSRAGVAPFDAELVIAHVQAGVHAVYDRHRYDAEKLAALRRWEDLLERIIEPPPENVVALPSRAGG
jgi:integrase